MSDQKGPSGRIRTEVHGLILKIIIDNPAKKNSFTPAMMVEMSNAMTLLDSNDDYWAGVVCAEGADFTSGLDMPKFFGPNAEKIDISPSNIDAFALKGRCRKPIVTAVQGIVYTIGIDMMLARYDGRHSILHRTSSSRFPREIIGAGRWKRLKSRSERVAA